MRSPEPKSGIMDIHPYVGGKSGDGDNANVAKLSSNETPLGPSSDAIEAAKSMTDQLHRYPDGGAAELCETLATQYDLEASRIICGNGSDELLSLVMLAYAGPGDEVLISEHGFLMYEIYARACGATPVKAPEKDRTSDVDALLAAVTEKTKILFLANPNNPTGTYIPHSEVVRLRDNLPSHVLLVLDAAYAEYVSLDDYQPGIDLVRAHDNVVMTRTFSKIYGLSALRIGWAYCPENIVQVLHRIRGPFNTNMMAQKAAVAAVKDQAHVDRARAHNDKWLPILTQRLRGIGLEVTPSVGNFILIDFAGSSKSSADADKFLTERGLLLRNVAGYGLPSCLRMSLGTDAENIAVMDALQEFLGH